MWQAIKKLGGVKATAKLLGYPKKEVHRWIDEHYIPHGIVKEVAQLTLYSIPELQLPSRWMENNGFYWPASGYCAERAADTEELNSKAFRKHGKDATVNQAYRAAIVKAQARTLKNEQMNIEWEMLVESARAQAITPPECLKYMEAFEDDLKGSEGDYPKIQEDGDEIPSESQCHVHERWVEGAGASSYIGTQEECPFCQEELGLREVDTQLIPE